MKTNKLILSLFASVVLVVSSCTQARYAHLTVRGKEGTRVVNSERKKTTDQDAPAVYSVQIPEVDDVDIIAELPEDRTERMAKLAENAANEIHPKLQKKALSAEKLQEAVEVLVVNAPPVLTESKVVKKAYDRSSTSENAREVSGLVWLILVILLVLLIIELVGKIFPGLLQIIGLLLLILLLLWLLGMV